jgi:hypothetical protein
VVTDVLKKWMAESAPAGAAQFHELLRIPHGKHPEQHRVDQAEDRGVGADTQSQRNQGYDGKAGAPPEHTEPESQVLPQIVDDAESARVPASFLDQFHSAEGPQSRGASLLAIHAGPHVVLDLSFEMKAQLLVHLGFEPAFTEQGTKK